MPRYSKAVITVTVLAEESPKALEALVQSMDLATILEEMDTGAMIGTYETTSVAEVPPEKIHEELLAVGNDGTFFGSLDSDDEE
jgi:hypothetical protein